MNTIQTILTIFQSQTKSRQFSLISGVVLIIIITIALMFWALSPSFGILFNQLDSHDANQIITQLEKEKISYQVRNQGRDILINKQLIDKTRIKLMGSDVALTHTVGFELFDKTDFGMTDFSQKINYQRALQGELERTINSLDEVKQARVHLSIPEHHLFQQDDNLPRVAVTLHLNQALTLSQIKSIQQLITASVANLTIQNVMMVDQNGNGLVAEEDDSVSGHFQAKKNVEHYLNEKVMQMLQRIFPNEGVMVKIDATLNYDELQRERIKPQQNGAMTHEKETRHTTPSKAGKKTVNQDVMLEKTWQLGKEKEQFTKANGTIERLTISVALPNDTSHTQLLQVTRMVKSIVGFNALRGDTISVEALIKKQNIIQDVVQQPIITSPSYQQYYLAGVIILGSIAWIGHVLFRRTKRRRLLAELSQWLIEHE